VAGHTGRDKKSSSAARRFQSFVLLMGCAGLHIGGLTMQLARGQAEGRPHIEYQRRIEWGMRQLRELPPADRLEVTQRLRNGFIHTNERSQIRARIVLEAINREHWGTSDNDYSLNQGQTVFIHFKHENGRAFVSTRRAADYWLEEMKLESLAPTWHPVESGQDLHHLLGDAGSVVDQSDSLPQEWRNMIQPKAVLRGSDSSPKKGWYEYTHAAQILDRPPEAGKVRILSALPHATGMIGSFYELYRMGRPVLESERWRNLQKQMDQLQDELRAKQEFVPMKLMKIRSSSHHKIETATKDAFIQELAHGNKDFVVLIAHFDGKRLHFPDGSTLTKEELSKITRETAPERTLVLISCDTGSVNQSVESLGEIALRNKLALNVIAPAHKVDAEMVPDLLRGYLMQGKSINDMFVKQENFNIISEASQVPRYSGRFWIHKQKLTASGRAEDESVSV